MLKTNQIVIRPFQGKEIRQRTEDSYINATDLITIYSKQSKERKDTAAFLKNKQTKDFLDALAEDLKDENSCIITSDLYAVKRGKNGGTWMHPYLFMKFAMWINPVFEVQVMKWLYDNLINQRHQAGDYFKEMTKALHDRLLQDGINQNPLEYKKEINFINRLTFGSEATNQRKRATEKELKKLSELQRINTKLLEKGYRREIRWERLRDFNEVL